MQVTRAETLEGRAAILRSVRSPQPMAAGVEELAVAGQAHLQVGLAVAREQKDRQQEQVRMAGAREELVPLR